METEMQTYYDARSIPWQDDERGEAFQGKIQELTEMCAALEQFEQEYFP